MSYDSTDSVSHATLLIAKQLYSHRIFFFIRRLLNVIIEGISMVTERRVVFHSWRMFRYIDGHQEKRVDVY